MKIILLSCCMFFLLFGTVEAQKKGKKEAVVPKLDFSNPEDALKAERKIHSSLNDGENVVYWWEGKVYSRVAGEKDRLLFTYQAMNVRASVAVNDPQRGVGYRMVSRELLFYMDPTTNQIVRKWTNPFTSKEVEVVHVNNDPVNGRPTFVKDDKGNDFKMRGYFHSGTYFSLSEIPLFYSNPLAGDYQDYIGGTYHAMEIFNMSVSEAELLNASKPTAEDVVVSWTRISKWLPWMEMNDRAGYLIFSGHGKKIKNWDLLPEALKAEIKANYPIYTQAPPTDDTRPNDTSWTVFKRFIDGKRKAGK